jgi:hypothetical protein
MIFAAHIAPPSLFRLSFFFVLMVEKPDVAWFEPREGNATTRSYQGDWQRSSSVAVGSERTAAGAGATHRNHDCACGK